MASAQGSQYVKPGRGLVKLDLIRLVKSNQAKHQAGLVWLGLAWSAVVRPNFV